MIELNNKYVLHVPRYRYVEDKLVPIATRKLVNQLIDYLDEKGYHSLYVTKVKGYYKKRCFDEILITVFVQDITDNQKLLPSAIFSKWFKDNNDILQQEAFAYEHNTNMIIEELD